MENGRVFGVVPKQKRTSGAEAPFQMDACGTDKSMPLSKTGAKPLCLCDGVGGPKPCAPIAKQQTSEFQVSVDRSLVEGVGVEVAGA